MKSTLVAYDSQLTISHSSFPHYIAIQQALEHRANAQSNQKMNSGRNVAAIVLLNSSNEPVHTVVAFSTDTGLTGHSEKIVWERISKEFTKEQLFNLRVILFTERIPCEDCDRFLDSKLTLGKDEVYYAIPPGDPQKQTKTLEAILPMAIDTLDMGKGPPVLKRLIGWMNENRQWMQLNPLEHFSNSAAQAAAWVNDELKAIEAMNSRPTSKRLAANTAAPDEDVSPTPESQAKKLKSDLYPNFRTSFFMQPGPSSHTFQAIGSLG